MSINSNPQAYGGLGPLALGVTWTLGSIATILLALRIYVLVGMQRRVGQMQLAWTSSSWFIGFIGEICLTIAIRAFGIGNHLPILLQTGTVADAVLWVWICQCFALTSIALGKCAAVASIVAIQGPTGVKSRMALWAIAVINVLMDGAVLIAVWFQCNPVPKLWNTMLPGSCAGKAPVTSLAIAVGSVNSASDFIFALYPVYMLWTTQISRSRKIGASLLLGCIAFAGVCAAIKSSELYNIGAAEDPTYDIMHLVIWAFTEQWIVIIVVMIPGLGPLLHQAVQILGSYRTNKRSTADLSGSHELHKFRPDLGGAGGGISGATSKRPRTFVRSEGFRQMPPGQGDEDLLVTRNPNPSEGYIVMQKDTVVEQERVGRGKGDEEMVMKATRGTDIF